MVIYGEYLFTENMIIGMVILFFTEKFTGEKINRVRFIFCGICCGLYAFVLFTSISGVFSLTGKLFFSVGIVRIAFGRGTVKKAVERAAVFLLLTILYGGTALAIITSFGWTGVTAATGLYLPPLTYVTIMAVASCSAWILWFFLRCINVRRMDQRVLVETELVFCGVTQKMTGFIDSGNTLKDPLTGNPVCIVRSSFMEELLEKTKHPESRYTVIPYQSIGVERGMLEGYRADRISINGRQLKSPVLAVCKEETFLNEENKFDILLPGIMLERGIHGDDSSVENLAGRQIDMEMQTCILHRRK